MLMLVVAMLDEGEWLPSALILHSRKARERQDFCFHSRSFCISELYQTSRKEQTPRALPVHAYTLDP